MIKKFISKLFDIHPDAMSFKQGMDLTGIPVCTFNQGDKKLNFILDTGSTDNIIDSNVLKKIEHQMVEGASNTLTGMDGITHKVEVCNITVSYKDREYPFTYLVKDMKAPFAMFKRDYGVNIHGMIGSNFFNHFRYVLDFGELIAYSKK